MFGASMMNTAAGLASLIAGFGSSIIVARVLGVNGSGIVAYALWIMTAATLVSDLGLPQALLRFAAKGSDSERIALLRALTRRFALSTGLLATVMAGFAMWRYSTGSPATAWVWMATAGLFLCYAYSTLSLGVAQGLGHFRQTSVNTVAGCLIQPVSVAVGAVFLGPAGAILGQMVRHLPQALGLRRYFAFEAAPADYSGPSAVNPDARNNWMSGGLAALLSSRVELAVIGAYLGVTEIGQYAAGATMASMIVQLTFSLAAVLVPLFSSYQDREDSAGLICAYQRSLLGLSLLLAPICFGGAAIAPVLVPAMFGEAFRPAGEIGAVLVAFAFAQVLTTVPYRLMLARERTGVVLHLSVWEGVASMAALLVVTPLWGAMGAAFVKGVTSTVTAIIYLAYCRVALDTPVRIWPLLKIVLSAALCASAAWALLMWKNDLIGLTLSIPVGATTYIVALICLSAIPEEDRRLAKGWAAERLTFRKGQ